MPVRRDANNCRRKDGNISFERVLCGEKAMLTRTKEGVGSVRLKKGKHWAKCGKCGDSGLRGITAKLCRWKWPLCNGFVYHMPDTCVYLGGACCPNPDGKK